MREERMLGAPLPRKGCQECRRAFTAARGPLREVLIEHLVIGELFRTAWWHNAGFIEVVKPQVDDVGYDVVLEVGDRSRHVHVKASFRTARTATQKIHMQLGDKYHLHPRVVKKLMPRKRRVRFAQQTPSRTSAYLGYPLIPAIEMRAR